MKKAFASFLLLFSHLLAHFQSPEFVWAKQWGSTGNEWGNSIAIDDSGNVFTTGYFNQTVDFDPGEGILLYNALGFDDIFISKLDASGGLVWAKALAGNSGEESRSIAVDKAGNVYTTGTFQGTVDFDPGIDSFFLTANGYDVFVSKLDSNGNFVWARQLGGTGMDIGTDLTVSQSNKVLITGFFKGTADFDPGVNTHNLISYGGEDIFVCALDTSGSYLWAKGMGGAGNDYAHSLAVDASLNVYTTGYFEGTCDFNPGLGTQDTAFVTSEGNTDIFISKLDSLGNYDMIKRMGNSGEDFGHDIVLDASSNVYVTGYFGGTVDFNPGVETYILTSQGNHDIFIAKLETTGDFIWAKSMGGLSEDRGNAITVDKEGNSFVTGLFSGLVDFDPGEGVDPFSSVGSTDVFITMFDPGGNYKWTTVMGGVSSNQGLSIATDGNTNVHTTGYYQGLPDFDPGEGIVNLGYSSGYDVFVQKINYCVSVVNGCTDSSANNYNPVAQCDDGSCSYNDCPGDFDFNGFINTGDLLLFMSDFGCVTSCGSFDLTGDGVVNTSDLLLFMGIFGTICP